VTSGTYYFFLRIDHNQSLIESDEDNNVYVAKATFTIEPPDLAPLVDAVPPTFTGPPNPTVTVVWGVTNTGLGQARPSWRDGVYFSKDPVLDWQDSWVGDSPAGPLEAGASYWHTNALKVPVTQSGTYYLIFKADSGEEIYDANRSNNIVAVPVTFSLEPPDLVPELLAPPVIGGPPNPTATLVWRVQNQGIGLAEPPWDSWLDVIYLSKDSFLGAYATTLVQEPQSGPIAPGESYWRTNTVRFPMTKSGNRYLVLQTDSYNSVFESNEGNNTAAVPVRFEISRPDLVPLSFVAPSEVTGLPNPMLTLAWGVTNQGAGLAEPRYGSWSDRVYLSTNNVFDETAVYVGDLQETKTLPAGGSYWRTNQFQVPVLQSGTYYLFFITDAQRTIYESDFNNNGVGLPIEFTILPPDLAVLSMQALSNVSGTPRPTIMVAWGVTNVGAGAAKGPWRDVVYLSRTPTVNDDTPVLGDFYEYGPVQPGGTYWRTNAWTTGVVESGTYYLIFETDVRNELHESNLDNNTVVMPVVFQISPPDLAPFAIQVPAEVTAPVNPSLTVIWGVTNQGTGSTPRVPGYGWSDRFTLCKTPPPAGGIDLGTYFWSMPLGAGESGWATNTFRFPLAESGTYYLVLDVNRSEDMFEANYANNQYWVPITIYIQPPDLAPVLFRAPAEVTGGLNPQIKLTWGVTNQGPGTARGYNDWWDRVFLSRDALLDYNDSAIAWSTETGPVSPGGVYWRSQTVGVPVTESGTYYLILSVDDDQVMSDLNYSNNTAVLPIHFNVEPPDLTPLVWNVPTSIDDSAFPQVTLVWGTTNQGVGVASAYPGWSWYDRVYLTKPGDPPWSGR
jgi:subtilase family serine protease